MKNFISLLVGFVLVILLIVVGMIIFFVLGGKSIVLGITLVGFLVFIIIVGGNLESGIDDTGKAILLVMIIGCGAGALMVILNGVNGNDIIWGIIAGLILSVGFLIFALIVGSVSFVLKKNIFENDLFNRSFLITGVVLGAIMIICAGVLEDRTMLITKMLAKVQSVRKKRPVKKSLSPEQEKKLSQEKIRLQEKIEQENKLISRRLNKVEEKEKRYQQKLSKLKQECNKILAEKRQELLLKEKQFQKKLQELQQEEKEILVKKLLALQSTKRSNSFFQNEKTWQDLFLQALLFTIFPFLSATLLQYLLEEFLKKQKLGYVLIMLVACVVAQMIGYYFLIVSASMGCGAGSLLAQERRPFSLR